MPEFDVLIKDGTIVDGTRVPRYRADIGIKNGKIAKIGRLKSNDAAQVLDATGLIVAPGAIDGHTHYDFQLHWDPYCTIGSWHGVTSVIAGTCGFGAAPLHAKDLDRAILALTRNEAIPFEPVKAAIPAAKWETFPQYLDYLDRLPLGVNVFHLVPVSPLVAYVRGGFDEAKTRLPNEQEMAEIIRLLQEAIEAGANGWSFQRLFPEGKLSVQRDYDGTPMITDILPDEFYLRLAQALGEKGEGCIQYTQAGTTFEESKEDRFKRDVEFGARMAEVSGRPAIFNAVTINDRHPLAFRAHLKALEEAHAQGRQVFGQALTARIPARLTLENWNLFDNSPSWREATLGTIEEKKAKLANPELRHRMKQEFDSHEYPLVLFGEIEEFLARKVHRADLKDKYEGLSVKQIAEREGKHLIDAMLDLTVADDLKTEWQTPSLNENAELARELMSSPHVFAGLSDGGAHVKFITPGTWPTDLLTWMVREKGVLSLEEAHFRMSGLSAWAAGFKDRGTLREGMAADMMIYDLAKLKILPSEILNDLPLGDWRRVQRAEGYRWIVVNGQVIFEDGKCTNATPGRLLRHGRAS
jgi:N-acyl-D-aspartate/D-glutamate deacylase